MPTPGMQAGGPTRLAHCNNKIAGRPANKTAAQRLNLQKLATRCSDSEHLTFKVYLDKMEPPQLSHVSG